MIDLDRHDSLGSMLREAFDRYGDDLCLIEAPGIRFDSKAKNVTFNGQMAVLD